MAAEERDPPTTVYELREAVRCELADFVDAEGVGLPLDREGNGYDLDEQQQTARIVRDLAGAIESLDRVVAASSTFPVTPPFNVDALAVRLWNASQEAGASTDVGDAVVAELKAAMS